MNFNDNLSEREIQVLERLCQEKTAKEIGGELGLSKRTIEGHKQDLILKTGSRSMIGLVLHAIRNNIYQIN